MAEREFEAELERMFNQPPTFTDNDAFARRVNARLNKSWRLRAVAIATAGAVGGLITVSQTIGSGLNLRVTEASAQSVQRVDGVYTQAVSQLDSFGGVDLAAVGLNGNLVAMMAIALLLGMAAMGMRLIDEA
jgi:outer membrane PBP1 activator LpoA protein